MITVEKWSFKDGELNLNYLDSNNHFKIDKAEKIIHLTVPQTSNPSGFEAQILLNGKLCTIYLEFSKEFK